MNSYFIIALQLGELQVSKDGNQQTVHPNGKAQKLVWHVHESVDSD